MILSVVESTVEVWLKGHEEERITVTIHVRPPLTPMNVRDHCCRTGLYSWSDYQRIRYKRVSSSRARCARCERFPDPSKECLFYNVAGLTCRYENGEII